MTGAQGLQTFAGRSVFVTGHTGFKGSWLTIWLHRLGARITGYSLAPPTRPSNFDVSGVRGLLSAHHVADIRDEQRLSAAIEEANPDVILHLAAQPLVRESYVSPKETFDVNVMGTCALLDCVRRRNKPAVVLVVTSDKCYENREQIWGYRECDAMGGSDPYSASKGACELVVASYRRSFFSPDKVAQHGIKLASARAGNVIGGGDWASDRIVTDLVLHLAAGEPVLVRNPAAIRPWQHVLEPLSGYLALTARMLESNDARWCDGWNFGPPAGHEAPVVRLVEALIQAWGDGTWKDVSDPHAWHEAKVLRLAIEKSLATLDWHPRWTFSDAVSRTANWYRRFYQDGAQGSAQACRDDIDAYMASFPGLSAEADIRRQ